MWTILLGKTDTGESTLSHIPVNLLDIKNKIYFGQSGQKNKLPVIVKQSD